MTSEFERRSATISGTRGCPGIAARPVTGGAGDAGPGAAWNRPGDGTVSVPAAPAMRPTVKSCETI